jgi:hypothetical protein
MAVLRHKRPTPSVLPCWLRDVVADKNRGKAKMTKMIKTSTGYLLESEIVSARGVSVASKVGKCRVTTKSGKSYIIEGEQLYNFPERVQLHEEAIAALEGFFCLVPSDQRGKGRSRFKKLPIVGWIPFISSKSIDEDCFAYWARPIFAFGYADESMIEEWGYLTPDGKVIGFNFIEHPSVDAFLESQSKLVGKLCKLI